MSLTKKKASSAKPQKKVSKQKSQGSKPKMSAIKSAPAKPTAAKNGGFSPEVKVYVTPEILYQETAHLFMQISRGAVDARGRFVMALSGGSTPKGLFQQLTEEPYLSLVPWHKTYIYWVDERYVPLDNEMSNYRLAQEFLLSKVRLPKDHFFPMVQINRTVEQCASLYEARLRKFFGTDGVPRLDFALMGMGEDGHTAGLFPGVPQLNEMEKWVVGYQVDKERKERISLTFPVLNAARFLLILATGQQKAARVKDVLEGPSTPPRYPIQYLRPTDASFLFALDAAAASLLPKKG
jgi:6-phosphogluconolactonase